MKTGGALALLATCLGAATLLLMERLGGPPPTNQFGEPLPTGAEHQNWKLTFADEFDGSGLDSTRWVDCYWWDDGGCTNLSNMNAQWYVPSALTVRDGTLVIEASENPVVGIDDRVFPYTSGIVTTGRDRDDLRIEPKYAFTYGWAEIRMRPPAGQGLWSAFWLLPTSHESKPEIDVVEILGDAPDRFEAHLHYRNDDGEDRSVGSDWHGPDFSAAFHTFGVEWTPEAVNWFVDGNMRWTVSEHDMIPHEPMYLLVNLAVGGEWPGYPNETTQFPAHLQVDYVRVWQDQG